jgi:hypothetical protein
MDPYGKYWFKLRRVWGGTRRTSPSMPPDHCRYTMQNLSARTLRLTVGLSFVLFTSASVADEVDLVILAGQSNMVGRAATTATIPGSDPVDAQVQFYYEVTNTGASFFDSSGQTFGPLTPWRLNASVRNFGPEISLGRELVHSQGLNPAIVKYAVGGSDIARWQPGTTYYNKLITSVTNAIGKIQAAGDTVNLLGLVWLQGESDAIDSARADAYAGNLTTFIAGFRGQLDSAFPSIGFADTHVFLVEPADWKHGSRPEMATAADIAKVDQALMNFAADDANASFIPTSDFVQFEYNIIHFNKADQLTLGMRIAASIRQSQIPEPATMSLLLVAMTGLCCVRVRSR